MRIVKLRKISNKLYYRLEIFTVNQTYYRFRFKNVRCFVSYTYRYGLPKRIKSHVKFLSEDLTDKLIATIILESINLDDIRNCKSIIEPDTIKKKMEKHPLLKYLLNIDQIKNMIDSIEVYKGKLEYTGVKDESYAFFLNKNDGKNIINKIKIIAKRVGFLTQYDIFRLIKEL